MLVPIFLGMIQINTYSINQFRVLRIIFISKTNKLTPFVKILFGRKIDNVQKIIKKNEKSKEQAEQQ
jgi:hypothetical protein